MCDLLLIKLTYPCVNQPIEIEGRAGDEEKVWGGEDLMGE
jgi:hypothetical protein